MFRLLAISTWLIAGVALAGDKPRISLVDFKGSKGAAVKKQLAAKLCKTFKCVKPGAGGDDVAVAAVVTGEVDGKSVKVSVYFDEDQEPVTRDVSLKAGKISATGFKSVTTAVKEAVTSGKDPTEMASASLTGSP